MSLNQLINPSGDGLNLEVKTINTLVGTSNNIRGTLKVAGLTSCDGGLTINTKVVVLNGEQTPLEQGLTFVGLVDTASSTFQFEKYNNTLHVSGIVSGNLPSIAGSKSIQFNVILPWGYKFSLPYDITQQFAISGGGCSILGVGTSRAQYIGALCYCTSINTYTILFNTGSGGNAIDTNGLHFLSFSVWLRNIIDQNE